MSDGVLDERGRALEEAFFHRYNQELLHKMKGRFDALRRIEALAEASGIQEQAVLQKLDQLGVSADSVAALTLVPLVEVAWADNKVQAAEREAILRAAAENGVGLGSAAYELLQGWLEERPAAELLASWRAYAEALRDSMTAESWQALGKVLVGRARRVADAAGGILGFAGRISADEREVLRRLEAVFDTA